MGLNGRPTRFWIDRIEALDRRVIELEAKNEKLQHEVMVHQVGDGYNKGHEHGSLVAVKYRDERNRALDKVSRLRTGLREAVEALEKADGPLVHAVNCDIPGARGPSRQVRSTLAVLRSLLGEDEE